MILSLGIQRLLPVPTYWSRHQVLTRRTISRRHPVEAAVEVEVVGVVVQGGRTARTRRRKNGYGLGPAKLSTFAVTFPTLFCLVPYSHYWSSVS
jgi:hypothetical protein